MNARSLLNWIVVWVMLAGLLAPANAGNATSHVRAEPDPSAEVRGPQLDAPLPPVEGRVIVRYRDAAAKSSIERDQVRASVSATLARAYDALPSVESLALPPDLRAETAVALLAADPRVEYAEPDYALSTHGVPGDEKFHAQWGLHNIGQPVSNYPSVGAGVDIDAPEAWEFGTGSSEVVVAVLDEGMDHTHPDLAANAWTNPGEIAGNGADDDGNGFVDDVHGWDFLHNDATTFDGANDPTNSRDFHGTHTSGTVGAVGNNGIGVVGVCWNVKLMSVKFLEGSGRTSDAIASVSYVVMMKRRGVNIRAINASWGGGDFSSGLRDAIAAAGAEGILFCASSGNGGGDGRADNTDLFPNYPSCYDLPNVISVGAWTRYDLKASYSNYGNTTVDLLAPGSLVASTGPNGSYYYSSGTSMAAPHVTGAAALLASIAPSLTADQIKTIIMTTTTPVVASSSVTGGRLNLLAAVQKAAEATGGDGDGDGDGDDGPPPPPPPPPPIILDVRYAKARKMLVVDGRQFSESSVIEIDGVPMPIIRRKAKFQLEDGTYIRLDGKAPGIITDLLPAGETVQVTVYDEATGARSDPTPFTRGKKR